MILNNLKFIKPIKKLKRKNHFNHSNKFVKFIINLFPLPKKILNFLLLISSEVSYSNKKIKKELNFKPSFSLKKEIAKLNE